MTPSSTSSAHLFKQYFYRKPQIKVYFVLGLGFTYLWLLDILYMVMLDSANGNKYGAKKLKLCIAHANNSVT